MTVSDRTALLQFRDGDEGALDDDNNNNGLEDPVVSTASSPLLRPGYRKRTDPCRCGLRSWRRGVTTLKRSHTISIMAVVGLIIMSAAFVMPFVLRASQAPACSAVRDGFICHQPHSRLWGQYSPYFSLASKSEISPDVPSGCTITFAQVLSRHGARYPTEDKSKTYSELIQRIKSNATSFSGNYAFLEDFEYSPGQEEMTAFGEAEMVESGIRFYERYRNLGLHENPFIRASGSPRVIRSAELFIDGFYDAKKADNAATEDDGPPNVNVVISEEPGSNNTLDHGRCDNFELSDPYSDGIEKQFADTYMSAIRKRIAPNLPGTELKDEDITYLMDLCPFQTVAISPDASIRSPFCDLFTDDDWMVYDYQKSLEKYYRYGAGHPLGPTQGVGFVNELIARLTSTPVSDTTSVNHTLDSSTETFPLNRTLYADFSHDNTMLSIFTALGLFNGSSPLPPTTIQTPEQMKGYSASWSVPFAGRAYIEKMVCDDAPVASEEYVRILLNERVVPLSGCPVDALGRCTLTDFVEGLSYARNGGDWAACFG
ncbi:hypothetical protein VTO42DRAFT_4985 [Malbranchea cinnamomea]